MRVFVDTNVLLDVLQQRVPHVYASSILWKACECGEVEGVVSALTFANIIYILRKDMTPARLRDILDRLELIFSFEDFTVQDMVCATEMEWSDYEDAIQCAQAARARAEYIVTRNVQDFAKSETPAITPQELLLKLKELREKP